MNNKKSKKTRSLSLVVLLFILSYSQLQVQGQNVNIIPAPREITSGPGCFSITSETKIRYSKESYKTAVALKNNLDKMMMAEIGLVKTEAAKMGGIHFIFDVSYKKEQYTLNVSEKGITIIASNNTGWFYGVQSLLQLFPSLPATQDNLSEIKVAEVVVNDSPRFPWREYMLDEARFFQGKEQVKMLLDEMALLKMNVFHWHLVDDQGWRIEIKKYPLLTEIGAQRINSRVDCRRCGLTDAPYGGILSGKPHGGFYTQEDIKEIVKYAEDRHITIIPEIDMPGHVGAAIASYPWLGTTGEQIQVPFELGVRDHVLDVSNPEVYKFLTDVLDEVIELFPSDVIHIGGDEVKFDQWIESGSIQSYMKEQNISSYTELQLFFTNRISQYLQSKGKRMMGWNEILGSVIHEYQSESDVELSEQLAEESIIHFWEGGSDLLIEAASNGFEMVISLVRETYLSLSYCDLPLSKSYAFEPIPEGLDPALHNKILGIGCELWGELLSTHGHMQFMTFPRIAAYAEIGWSEKENKDYDSFLFALKKFQKRWNEKGINNARE